ncbi:Retrovirus-related Pol polyprotein from transposon 297 [Labeo rohita]|uniref:ribonuclease H n=1 Tax=Labeo rohita TaxID=84645 RepID=A0A498MII4_LABRO|nr:Retrovirus-related Pol polyprotein from transposon 297 [Labeo rohita]
MAELEIRGVISKVSKPTPWVSSLCITEKKNGTLRVCLDPRDLNRAILRQHYNIPTLEDIWCKLAGKKLFTILDEKDGYWQIKLDEESAELCAFNTPQGRYRFHLMPFGIKSASEVFQCLNSESFGDIEGVFMEADDMIIAAATKAEHDAILKRVMNRAESLNVKFNKDKLQYMVNEVTYLGHVTTSDGVKLDESKVSAILQLFPPTDRKALQCLLGMTRYLSQYTPNKATLTAPLRLLLRKDITWQWHPEQQTAVDQLKTAITTASVLRYFDPKEPIEVQADASKDGLGATLMQKQQPIAYASRALSAAEKNYAQIEKELLAIVFALRKFHQYVYGVPIRVQSDHKPLEAIFSKPIGATPAHLQRMLLQLQRYDIHIVFTPGNQMLIADTLSRPYLPSDVQRI